MAEVPLNSPAMMANGNATTGRYRGKPYAVKRKMENQDRKKPVNSRVRAGLWPWSVRTLYRLRRPSEPRCFGANVRDRRNAHGHNFCQERCVFGKSNGWNCVADRHRRFADGAMCIGMHRGRSAVYGYGLLFFAMMEERAWQRGKQHKGQKKSY